MKGGGGGGGWGYGFILLFIFWGELSLLKKHTL